MDKGITFEQFWNRLIKVEASSGAIKTKFNGIQLYPLLRVRLFYAIAQQLGLFDNPHPNSTKVAEAGNEITNLKSFAKSKVVVLPFRRQVNQTDPYSDRILEILADPNNSLVSNPGSVKVLSFVPTGNDNDPDLQRLRAYFEKKHLRFATSKIRRIGFKTATKRWHAIIGALENEFGVSLDKLKKFPPLSYRLALAEQTGFAKFFKQIGAEHLFIVNAYSEQSIVLGARKAGVKVHEIQHGFITAMHPAYSYPSTDGKPVSVGHAPDSLLVWGEFWTDGVPLPKQTKAIVTGPTAAFTEYREKVARENRIIAKQILFTSQGAIATELLTSALNTAAELSDHKVIYRLHPNETLESYAELAKQVWQKPLPKNFSFSHKDPIFLDLVSQSEYLVGAFSTTLYEGLALGCKVLVLPLPGYEHVKRAIDLGDMTLVSSLKELPKFLALAKPASDPKRYYA